MQTTSNTTWWFRRFRSDADPPIRLFCFPYAGGGTGLYRDWSGSLPAWVDVLGVELPGRDQRFSEQPHVELPELVDELAVAIGPYLDRPFAFFGHSMGALVSFELARTLSRTAGVTPNVLFVSARRAPDLPALAPPSHRLDDQALLEEMCRHAGAAASIGDQLELLQVMLPVYRADLRLVETYRYEATEPLSCPIWALASTLDVDVPAADVEAWHRQTVGRFRCEVFPGGHFFIRSSHQEVLSFINQVLSDIT